ncbi:MAG TPA: aquaporin Z [Nocardioides sp.]|uniref:aquaporin Z n=1 Tax=Nocardioides sp. TaxID=35761 RepID=UPI002CA583F3|nr:aquaporin Z [Nocardioides sp.]HQR25762.1 aquaporin Z [Nocardioides sp.]
MDVAPPTTTQKLAAEFLGTFVLVFGGCGSAVLAATFLSGDSDLGIGFAGVALAFGLTVVVMAYAFGHVSGGHFNPAVTVGLAAAKRFAWKDTAAYIVTQVVAAIVAASVLYVVANGRDGFSAVDSGFASNGYGDRSPGGYSLLACLVIEVLLTAVFLYVIIGVTDSRALQGFAPLGIGLSLTLIHLISIPVTNTSVNPARSIGPALFAGGDAIFQLWLFILAPIAGALLAGFTYALLVGEGPIEGAPGADYPQLTKED